MGKESVDQIKEYLIENQKKGYNLYDLGNYLIGQGYNPLDVKEAMDSLTKKQFDYLLIFKKNPLITFIFLIILLLIIGGVIMYIIKSSSPNTSQLIKSKDNNKLTITNNYTDKNSEKELLPQESQNQILINNSEKLDKEKITPKQLICGYCEYQVDNQCLKHECCYDEECPINNICVDNKCIIKKSDNTNSSPNITLNSNITPTPITNALVNITNKTCRRQTDCIDSNKCTQDLCKNINNQLLCTYTIITVCGDEDGCCPQGCNLANDFDCVDKCIDGTFEGSCSTTKPKFCIKKNLTDDCETCGCQDGYFCDTNKKCVSFNTFYSNLSDCTDLQCNGPNSNSCKCGTQISDSRNPYCCSYTNEIFINVSIEGCFFCENPSNPKNAWRFENQSCLTNNHCNTSLFCKKIDNYKFFDNICCSENECASKNGCVKTGILENYTLVNTNQLVTINCSEGRWV